MVGVVCLEGSSNPFFKSDQTVLCPMSYRVDMTESRSLNGTLILVRSYQGHVMSCLVISTLSGLLRVSERMHRGLNSSK